MPSLAGPSSEPDDCDAPVVVHGRRAFVQRHPSRVGNVIYDADTATDCDGPAGPDACDLLAAELAVRDSIGQRARTAAYHRRDAVRAHFRLPHR